MVEILNLLSPRNIIIFILVLTRLSGLFTSAPFFSTFNLPMQIRVLFACTVAFIMYPMVAAKANFIFPHSMPELTVLIFLEFAIGFLIGFVANLVFDGIKIAGGLFSIQMGISMAEVLDPSTGETSSAIANIYTNLAIIIFFAVNAPHWLFESVYYSFFAMPIGLADIFTGPVMNNIITLSAQMFRIAFGLVMPMMAVLLTTDVLLGLMSKMMPQMNIFMVSLPIKIYTGLILCLVFLSSSAGYLKDTIGDYIKNVVMIFT